jgi:AcrR family transcriptional regulator
VKKAEGNGRVARTAVAGGQANGTQANGTRTDAPRSGRPQSVSTEVMLAEARRMVSEAGVAEFSVRELAKALGLVPGTIHARFGNKHELLAGLYLQRIGMVCDLLDALPEDSLADVTSLLDAVSPHLSMLRHEFVLHFENDGKSRPHLRPATWDDMKTSFKTMSDRCYELFRQAAANEGVTVIGGTQAKRLLWTVASTQESSRSAAAFDHADASYRRFVARGLLSALATPERRNG